MDLERYIDSLRSDGARFADVIAGTALSSPVPTCAAWALRDLVLHQGEVHRWATAIVESGAAKPSALAADFAGSPPGDAELVRWFVDGHARLVEALLAAPRDLACFTFLADPPAPLLFWARRQAHELAIHRIDAEAVSGDVTPVVADIAADGVDELLTGFAPRRHTPLHSETPLTLQVVLTDRPDAWRMSISDQPPSTQRGRAQADCTVTGTANDMYQALWNRQGTERLVATGLTSVLGSFRDNVKIGWR